jgi:hypothetical protein
VVTDGGDDDHNCDIDDNSDNDSAFLPSATLEGGGKLDGNILNIHMVLSNGDGLSRLQPGLR